MTLSDPRCALLPLALALACATTAMPVLAQGLQTSFEPGEPAPSQAAGALQVTIGNGPAAPYAAKRNAGYSGLHALRYRSEGGSARRELFKTDLPIEADTTLSWLVLPEIVGKDTVASTYVSLDLLLAAAFRPVRRVTSMGWRSAHARRASRRRCTRSSGRARQCGWATYPR